MPETVEELERYREQILRDLKAQFASLSHAQKESILAELESIAYRIAALQAPRNQ